jgi:hypothetical protein
MHIQHQLPRRRLRQTHPHHRLDQHAHRGHSRHRGGRGLNEIRAVFALAAVAERHGRTEDAREHLPAHIEPEGEVHVRGGNSAQRPEHENTQAEQEQMIAGGTRRRQPGPARRTTHRGGGSTGVHGGEILCIYPRSRWGLRLQYVASAPAPAPVRKHGIARTAPAWVCMRRILAEMRTASTQRPDIPDFAVWCGAGIIPTSSTTTALTTQ